MKDEHLKTIKLDGNKLAVADGKHSFNPIWMLQLQSIMKSVISSLVVDYKSMEWLNSRSQFDEMYEQYTTHVSRRVS